MSNLFIYWCLTGIICFIWLNLPIPRDEESQEKLNEISSLVPMSEDQLHLTLCIISLVFGGVILPLSLIDSLMKLITGEHLWK